jgi:F-type H+-transporting ATPase subunit alpha
MSYNWIFKRGVRIALRSKVNESLITGVRIIDALLPVGRGQRQLILGDRSTGKTSIFLYTVLSSYYFNYIASVDGFGSKRLFSVYIGISLNLSKLAKLLSAIIYSHYLLVIASHSSSAALLSFLVPMIGVSICERLRDRGMDSVIGFDDLSKHSKSYRQISLILGKIPSRDAFPADIFNIHSSLLERCGKLSLSLGAGSITAFPVIETINSDITDYIATNIISITDGQFYMSKLLFINSIRPAIDSGLSVSRIGSSAQCKLMKVVSAGLKNELTNLRLSDLGYNTVEYHQLLSLNNIFYHNHLAVSSLSFTILLLLFYRNSLMLFSTISSIYKLLILYCVDFTMLSYVLHISKHFYTHYLYSFLVAYSSMLATAVLSYP